VVQGEPVLSSRLLLPWMFSFIPNLCSGVYSCFRERAQLSLSREPGPVALKCKLKDAVERFVLAKKSEITMFKINLTEDTQVCIGFDFSCWRIKPNYNILLRLYQ